MVFTNRKNDAADYGIISEDLTLNPTATGIPDAFFDVADSIVSVNGREPNQKGLILRYDKSTGFWVPVDKEGRVLTRVTGGLNPSDSGYLSTLGTNIQSQYVNQNKPLVLLTEWSKGNESIISDSGFTEGAADTIFASMVQLDQLLGGDVGERDILGELVRLYDDEGDLIRSQGALFNSPLHFIGFSRGTVVNSEIIQRLGTFFPLAGGPINADGSPVLKEGKPMRDLQMTTVDPHDFYQESLKIDALIPGTILADFRDFHEPEVKVWENVTFADNYYQTVADPNGRTWTPNGREIEGADVNVLLNGRTGFTEDDRVGTPHGNVMSWYAGTVDLGLDEVDSGFASESRQFVYDQLGERSVETLLDLESGNLLLTPWYAAEGVGTGWVYSVLGGGRRPVVDVSDRVKVGFDNTDEDIVEGDFAVPTVFNGGFDVGISDDPNAPVPGWSFHNGDEPLLRKHLVDVSEIPTLVEPEPIDEPELDAGEVNDEPEVDEDEANNESPMLMAALTVEERKNFAVQMGGVNPLTPPPNNPEIVPDWGVLRFDLHAPKPATGTRRGGLQVTLQDTNDQSNSFTTTINLVDAEATNASYQVDTRKLGYANYGFETFHIDVPDNFRGKSAKVQFELLNPSNETIVYVDNVSYKSKHLKFGNPKEARYSNAEFGSNPYKNKLLLERPQYTLSYNGTTNTANWSSFQFKKEWLWEPRYGAVTDRRGFYADSTLPLEFDKLTNLYGAMVDGVSYDGGHLTPVAARNRVNKDVIAVNILSNIVPQQSSNNQREWADIERYTQRFVKKGQKEVYIIAGTHEIKPLQNGSGNAKLIGGSRGDITIPQNIWMVMLAVDPARDATSSSYTVGFYLENREYSAPVPRGQPKEWKSTVMSVNEIEAKTGYDFFSNIDKAFQEDIEENTVLFENGIIPAGWSPNPSAPLLSEETVGREFSQLSSTSSAYASFVDTTAALDTSVWHDSVFDNSATKVSIYSTSQIGVTEAGTSQIGVNEVGISQIGVTEVSLGKVGAAEVGTAEIGSKQWSGKQSSTAQIGTNQDSITQVGFTQFGIAKVGITQVSPFEEGARHHSVAQVSPGEISTTQISRNQVSPTQVGPTQVNSLQFLGSQVSLNKIPLPSSIPSEQLFNIHNPTPASIYTIKDTAQTLWNTLLAPTTPLNIDLQLVDLPTSQLAEAVITKFNPQGHPSYDNYIQNTPHILTPDGSHLDPEIYPYDLMNPTLTPGVRKLPSALDIQILNAVRNGNWNPNGNILTAPLDSEPLIGITNGSFDENNPTQPDYGWTTRGATTILNTEAILTEDSPKNSQFAQTFIIPENAKYLKFTLKDTQLGNTPLDPPDAFEVALLDADTKNSLINIPTGLTFTDAFLNIQHDGQIHTGNGVTLLNSTQNSQTFTVDLNNIPTSTVATLYFDLLGFGNKDAKVIIDNITILNDLPAPPIANNDTATTAQNQPVTINILDNDSNAHDIAIKSNPGNGTVQINPDRTITYTPNNNFIGTDTFTYIVNDSDRITSNNATVEITVNSIAPTITAISGDTNINEGTIAHFTATATSSVNDALTYTWNFGDGSEAIGSTVNHTFGDNGVYNTTLTVTTPNGAASTENLTVNVNNIAPTVDAGTDSSAFVGTPITFNGNFSDPGILDTQSLVSCFIPSLKSKGFYTLVLACE